ncbi:hypothetical protein DR999_PMT09048 [Platysternon megacephalum]|uniref:Uncharacterized protein n=1 Tax=Platysternon megacephalum TaxID=55544 RepID=A0A4D9EKJ6_9SAUR|nr:hypothetical protein DR999_PMT09048 [Platysternon megacephalum]
MKLRHFFPFQRRDFQEGSKKLSFFLQGKSASPLHPPPFFFFLKDNFKTCIYKKYKKNIGLERTWNFIRSLPKIKKSTHLFMGTKNVEQHNTVILEIMIHYLYIYATIHVIDKPLGHSIIHPMKTPLRVFRTVPSSFRRCFYTLNFHLVSEYRKQNPQGALIDETSSAVFFLFFVF